MVQREIKGNKKAMKTSDFYYDLPQELIAQDPLEDRSASRLMHLDKVTGEIVHGKFRDILQYLQPGDCLVINDTKVLPARLYGRKVGTDAAIEILLLKRKDHSVHLPRSVSAVYLSCLHCNRSLHSDKAH